MKLFTLVTLLYQRLQKPVVFLHIKDNYNIKGEKNVPL